MDNNKAKNITGMSIEEISEQGNFMIGNDRTPDIMVVGVGGGGNNAINNMYKQDVKDVAFVVCNTDNQALENSPVSKKLLLGPTITRGKGAGNDPKKAQKAAEESEDDIREMLSNGTKMVFITAGMGGGTGTGAAPVVARVARELGLLTIGIVTIPFLFEGQTKIEKALDGADEMSKYVDALLVINNERLSEIYSDLTFLNAFGKADDTLTIAARSISELITGEGYINLDFNDVDTTLRNGGAAIISSGYGEGENRVSKAFDEALKSPLLKNRDIMKSKKLLFNIYFSDEAEQPFAMSETKEITAFVSGINEGVDIIWGATIDKSLGNKVKITILAAGFDMELRDSREIETKEGGVIKFPQGGAQPLEKQEGSKGKRIEDVYGQDKVNKMTTTKDNLRTIVLSLEAMDDDAIVEALEKSPTYTRDKVEIENLRTLVKSVSEGKPAELNSKEESHSSEGQTISFA
jgi:cell division protein FtsZ